MERKLYYTIMGEGEPLILIHGYLADSNIWGVFADKLSESYQVIMLDLPGHGNSELFSSVNKMELLAKVVHELILHLKIGKVTILGHSLGGYVALAYLEKYPENITKLILLNSHPWEDDEKKKALREKEAQLIELGKKEMLIRFNIASSVAKTNRERLIKTIKKLEVIALSQPEPGILSMLRGMKYRDNREEILSKTRVPILIILGEEDDKIDHLKVKNQFSNLPHISIQVLNQTGHLSMLERPEEVLHFISNISNPEFD